MSRVHYSFSRIVTNKMMMAEKKEVVQEGLLSDGTEGIQQSPNRLTRRDTMQRKLDAIESLISEYNVEYLRLGKQLSAKKRQRLTNSAGVDTTSQQTDTKLRHPLQYHCTIEPEVLVGEERTQNAVDGASQRMTKTGLLETSSHALSCREMDRRDALALLCGESNTYYIRNTAVTLGRESSVTGKIHCIDVELKAEAHGKEKTLSRLQGRLFLDMEGSFKLQNIGHRDIFVDGKVLKRHSCRELHHLSLIQVSTCSLLFMKNSLAIARLHKK